MEMRQDHARAAFSDWLHGLLQTRMLSQSALARLIGVNQSTVSTWVSGQKTPEAASCARLAEVAGVPLERLLRLAGHAPAQAAPARRPTLREEVMQLVQALPLEVAVYRELPVHAGEGGVPLESVYLPAARRRRDGSVVGLVVRGSCMAPGIEDGDIVVVDLEEEVQDGDVVAVELDGEWALRRCWFERGSYRLVCDNPGPEAPLDLPHAPERVYAVIDVRRGRPRRGRRGAPRAGSETI